LLKKAFNFQCGDWSLTQPIATGPWWQSIGVSNGLEVQ
jgi:hypothetical protein